jgi:hypothetical protein
MFFPLSTTQISVTPPLCPFNITGQVPSIADHILMVMSAPPLAMTSPDGKNLQQLTSEICPFKSHWERKYIRDIISKINEWINEKKWESGW